jgi:hypothetical protein
MAYSDFSSNSWGIWNQKFKIRKNARFQKYIKNINLINWLKFKTSLSENTVNFKIKFKFRFILGFKSHGLLVLIFFRKIKFWKSSISDVFRCGQLNLVIEFYTQTIHTIHKRYTNSFCRFCFVKLTKEFVKYSV